jgi:hypothetical protein
MVYIFTSEPRILSITVNKTSLFRKVDTGLINYKDHTQIANFEQMTFVNPFSRLERLNMNILLDLTAQVLFNKYIQLCLHEDPSVRYRDKIVNGTGA